ncbi:MAG: cupin domain-containing protein [Thermodesulfobacteriota bacterium]|nr:cupin domain-containing protein [Thermodesulfobacteriota bacterium]
MIIRNVKDREVMETSYLAHGGAIAQMILDRRTLKEIGFLAIGRLEAGKMIESHIDPMEEIYFLLNGEGEMSVDEETRHVGPGDAIWIPTGSRHSLFNSGKEELVALVIASPVW